MYADQITEARGLASPVPRNQTAADKSPWIVVQYVPTLGTDGTSATIAIATAAETMTFLVDGVAPAGADAIGASGIIDLVSSTYDTMGELVDYINGQLAWRAYLVGCLRSEVPSHLLNISAARCEGANGLTLAGDSSDSLVVATAVSGERFVNNGRAGHLKDFEDKCSNSMLLGAFNLGDGTGAITLKFYTGQAGIAETQIAGAIILTEDTQKLLGDSSGTVPYITATLGHRLIVRATTDSLFDAYAEFNVTGSTAVLKNDRFVDYVNYTE